MKIRDLPDRSDLDLWAFMAHVSISDGCWEWNGPRIQTGYGVFSTSGGSFLAHRLSWVLFKGEGTNGLYILHSCDNRKCVNPDHLSEGTARQNAIEMHSRGRADYSALRRGITHHWATLTEADVRQIRKRREAGLTYRKIASEFGISRVQAGRIAKREAWTHVL